MILNADDMKVIIDDENKTIVPVAPFTIKELMNFSDVHKLDINKWRVAPSEIYCAIVVEG